MGRLSIVSVSNSLAARVVDEGLVGKLQAAFEANGIDQPDDQIREKVSGLMAAAVTQARSRAW